MGCSAIGQCLAFLIASTSCVTIPASDWTGWLGPERNGRISADNVPEQLPSSVQPQWTLEVGTGYGTPLVVGDRVFQHARQGNDEVLWCLDRKTGKEIWKQQWSVPFKIGSGGEWHGAGPKSSPCYSAGRIFIQSIDGELSCWNCESGDMLWRTEYAKQYQPNHPYWGSSASPVIHGDLVIVHFGNDESGELAALNVETGEKVWANGQEGASYSSPVLMTTDSGMQVIDWNHDVVCGVDAETGRRLWEFPLPHLTHNQNMPTPIIHQGRVIIGGENRGVVCLLPEETSDGTWQVQQLWFQKQVALDMATALMHGDLLFGLTHYGKGRLFCLDTASGDVVWQGPGRLANNATFLALPEHVVSLLDNGRMQILEASGSEHRIVRDWKLSERPTWAPPVWLKSGLLVKDQTHLTFLQFNDPKPKKQAKQQRRKPGKGPSIIWVNEPRPNQLPLPPRTQHLTFHSELVDKDIGYCVYLPTAYDDESSRRFPVIYNLHGNGGNEFTGVDSIQVLHEGIEEGRYPPMIMVLPNGGHSTFYKNSADGKFPIEDIFLKEFIPYIDQTYRTIGDRTGRCIEGFSMGGRGATRLAMKHPEMFCSLFCQAGNVPHLLETFDAASPEEQKTLLLGEDRANWEADDVYRLTTENADRIRKNVRILIACGSEDGGHIKTIRDWHQHLLETKIDHTYIELEGLAHKRTEMIERLKPIWFDYHVESLAAVNAAEEE